MLICPSCAIISSLFGIVANGVGRQAIPVSATTDESFIEEKEMLRLRVASYYFLP